MGHRATSGLTAPRQRHIKRRLHARVRLIDRIRFNYLFVAPLHRTSVAPLRRSVTVCAPAHPCGLLAAQHRQRWSPHPPPRGSLRPARPGLLCFFLLPLWAGWSQPTVATTVRSDPHSGRSRGPSQSLARRVTRRPPVPASGYQHTCSPVRIRVKPSRNELTSFTREARMKRTGKKRKMADIEPVEFFYTFRQKTPGI